MANNEIITKLNELAELRKMADELSAEIEAIQDELKAHMTENDTDTITAGPYKVSWKSITSTRIDTTALRKDLPEIWQEYGKTWCASSFRGFFAPVVLFCEGVVPFVVITLYIEARMNLSF